MVLLYKSDPLRKVSKCVSDSVFSVGVESSRVRRFSLVPLMWLSWLLDIL